MSQISAELGIKKQKNKSNINKRTIIIYIKIRIYKNYIHYKKMKNTALLNVEWCLIKKEKDRENFYEIFLLNEILC